MAIEDDIKKEEHKLKTLQKKRDEAEKRIKTAEDERKKAEREIATPHTGGLFG